jgi:hypothetical protein
MAWFGAAAPLTRDAAPSARMNRDAPLVIGESPINDITLGRIGEAHPEVSSVPRLGDGAEVASA